MMAEQDMPKGREQIEKGDGQYECVYKVRALEHLLLHCYVRAVRGIQNCDLKLRAVKPER